MHLYLYDRQHSYLVNLIRMIRLYLPDCTIHANTNLTTWPTSQEKPADSIICLYNAADFPDLDRYLYPQDQSLGTSQNQICESFTVDSKIADSRLIASDDVVTSYNTSDRRGLEQIKTCSCHYIRLTEAADQEPEATNYLDFSHALQTKTKACSKPVTSVMTSDLQQTLKPGTDTISISSIPRTGHLYTLLVSLVAIEQSYQQSAESLNASTYQPSANQMICCLSFNSRHVNKWIRQMLEKALIQGYRTVYLPLMPPYEHFLTITPDTGPDLSDLLYRISVNLDAEEKISPYWQASEKGWFQFRPPVRSDDLLCCHPETVRVLISTLKQKLRPDTEQSFIIIDCRHIPFSFVLAAAALCNHLFIHLPEGNKQAVQAAEKEAAHLVNQMPDSCKVTLQKAEILAR